VPTFFFKQFRRCHSLFFRICDVLCVGGKSANILSATAANFHAVYCPLRVSLSAVDVKVALPPEREMKDSRGYDRGRLGRRSQKQFTTSKAATDYRSPNVFPVDSSGS